MTNIASESGPVKPEINTSPTTLNFDAIPNVHAGAVMPHVEVLTTARWREIFGFPTHAQLVDTFLDSGGRYIDPCVIAGVQIGGFVLPLSPLDLHALQDPARATFVSPNGVIVELHREGSRA